MPLHDPNKRTAISMDEQGSALDQSRPENFEDTTPFDSESFLNTLPVQDTQEQTHYTKLEWGEPSPVHEPPIMHDLVHQDIVSIVQSHPALTEDMANDLASRLQMGKDKYGQPLRAFNGRNALKDAYEESLDMLCYLRQTIFEERAKSLNGSAKADALTMGYAEVIKCAAMLRDML